MEQPQAVLVGVLFTLSLAWLGAFLSFKSEISGIISHWLQWLLRNLKRLYAHEGSQKLYRELERKRVSNFQCICCFMPWVAMCGLAIIATNYMPRVKATRVPCQLIAVIVCFSMCLFAPSFSRRPDLSPRHVKMACVLIQMIAIFRIAALEDMALFPHILPFRYLFRFTIGLALVDVRYWLCLNSAYSAVSCYKYHMWYTSFLDANLCQATSWLYAINECACLVLMTIVLAMFEFGLSAQIQASIDERASMCSLEAVQKLLSVICDAQFHLGPGMEILKPSNKAAHLLDPLSQDAVDELNGQDFRSFVHRDDLQRFMDFLRPPGEPPASINLHMQDASGSSRFAVDIFQVSLPEIDGPLGCSGYLLGIRYEEAQSTDSPECKEKRTVGFDKLEEVSHRQCQIDDCQDKEEAPSNSRPEGSDLKSFAAVGDLLSDSASSSAQSLSAVSVTHRIPLPELSSISFTCDALSPRFTVRRVTLEFAESLPSSPTSQLPELADWLLKDAWDYFIFWAQSELNAGNLFKDGGSACPGPLYMSPPMKKSNNEPLILEAELAHLYALPDDESSDDDDDTKTHEDTGLLVVLKARNLSQLDSCRSLRHRKRRRQQKSGASVVSGSTQPLMPIQESHGSKGGSGQSSGTGKGSGGSKPSAEKSGSDGKEKTLDA